LRSACGVPMWSGQSSPTMTPRTFELVASAILVFGGLGLLVAGHWLGGFAAVAVGGIAAVDSVLRR